MNTTLHIGIMPLTTTQGYGQLYSRRPVYIEYPESIEPIEGIKWLLNINHDVDSPYSKDMVWYNQQLLKIPLASLRPKVIAIENEPDHYLWKSIEDYCNELTMAAHTLADYRITNGGFTLPLYYWYFDQNPSDRDFFDLCIPDTSKGALLNGSLDPIQRVQYQLNVLKSLPIAFVNIHYYLRNEGEVAPMVRMINYVSKYVGKPAISNEAGIYAEGLLPDVIQIARETQMRFLIIYSGGKFCLPISKADFESAVK